MYADKEASEIDCVETTSDKIFWRLTLSCLVVRKGHRCLNKNRKVKFAGLFSADDLLLPPDINRLTQPTACKV